MTELLLKYEADSNTKKNSELTSLHYAAQNEHNEIIQLLLKYWADSNFKNNDELTSLHIAVKGWKVSTVKLLLDAEADKVIEDSDENTSLHLATELEIAQLLTDEPMIISWQVSWKNLKQRFLVCITQGWN